MQIYRSDSQDKFRQYWKKLWQSDHRRMVFGSMPIFTLSEELLLRILHRHNLSNSEIQEITDFWTQYRSHAAKLLREYKISLDVPLLSEEAFHDNPLSLWLSEIYFEKEIVCTYEEYQAHLEQTKAFAAQYQNCSIHLNPTPTFRNISFCVIGSKCVVVSKGKYPAIHFVIHHPKSLFRISPRTSCLHLFRHILSKSSLIHKVLPAVLASSGEKSDGAVRTRGDSKQALKWYRRSETLFLL